MMTLEQLFASQLSCGTTLMYIVYRDVPPDDGGDQLATLAEILRIDSTNLSQLNDLVFVEMIGDIPVFKNRETTTV